MAYKRKYRKGERITSLIAVASEKVSDAISVAVEMLEQVLDKAEG